MAPLSGISAFILCFLFILHVSCQTTTTLTEGTSTTADSASKSSTATPSVTATSVITTGILTTTSVPPSTTTANVTVTSVITTANLTTTSVPPSTTTRLELSVSPNLQVFWCNLEVTIPTTQNLNSTSFRAGIEDKLLVVYSDGSKRLAANSARRKKRAAVSGNLAVQLVALNRVGDTTKVNTVFFVRENGAYVPAATVVKTINTLTLQELSLRMNLPVNSAATVNDTTTTAVIDQRVWIVGAVLGTLGAVVVIIWLVLFIYARCLRPQPPSLLDVEAPDSPEFKSAFNSAFEDSGGPGRGHVRLSSGRAMARPVKAAGDPRMEEEEEEGDGLPLAKTTNLDYDLLADEVVRRLDKKMSKIVDRKLDSRTESFRDADRTRRVTASPAEDSLQEEFAPPLERRPRKGRGRKSRNSVTPSDDDSSLPPLRRTPQFEDEDEYDSESQRRRRRARLRAARDLDRALGIEEEDEECRSRKSKSKSKARSKAKSKEDDSRSRRRKSRPSEEEEDEEEVEEEATLERARERMTELLSDPYTVGDSRKKRRRKKKKSEATKPEPEGELLQPTAEQADAGHQPIRVMTSLRPEALKVAALTSTYSTGDEMEKIRPHVEKDLQTQPQLTLDVRGPTPTLLRSTAGGDVTPAGAFRPVAPPPVSQPPGQLGATADETDVVSGLTGGVAGAASPQPIIDSIREELKRLTARSDA